MSRTKADQKPADPAEGKPAKPTPDPKPAAPADPGDPKPSDLKRPDTPANLTALLQAGADAGAGVKVKRGRGKAKDKGIPVEIVAQLSKAVFDSVAVGAGDHWKITEAEAVALAVSWKPVLDYYDIPVNIWLLWIMAGVVTVGTVGPRVKRSYTEGRGVFGKLKAKIAARRGRKSKPAIREE
jgi:hypothetical protein